MRPLLLYLTFFALLVSCPGDGSAQTPPAPDADIPGIVARMSQDEFLSIYPKKNARTYRTDGENEWMTHDHLLSDGSAGTVTFHLQNQQLVHWQINDRPEIITEYLGEFCSAAIRNAFPKIHDSIITVLTRMPWQDFLKITDRRRPVIFTEFFDSGTAQFASSSEIISFADDAPAFENGLTIIKLSTALEAAQDPQAITGIIAHEIAHRVLDHVLNKQTTCQAERQANQLIKTWGFAESYKAASAEFGHEARGEGEHPCK